MVAFGAPNGLAVPSPTHAPHLSWSEDDATVTGYDVQRADGPCAPGSVFGRVGSTLPGVLVFDDAPAAAADATYCYQVVGHYPAGDATGGPVQVVFDNAPPSAPVFAPTIPSLTHAPVTVSASSSDAGGFPLKSFTVSVVGGGTLTSSSGATAQWSPGNGTYTLRAVATDRADNQATTDVAVTIDNIAPDKPVLSAPSPVAGPPTLFWDAQGFTYTVSRDGSPLGAIPATGSWTDPINPGVGLHTYVLTATDGALNSTSSSVTVQVISASATAPRNVSAASPTNAVPHLTWQKPTTFAVTSWQVSRDGAVVASIGDPNVMTFDDAAVGQQGPHTYSVTALSGATPGDPSAPVTVTYDTTPPTLGPAVGASDATGAVGVSWPAAADPQPGSGVTTYIVRRGAQTSPPRDPTDGTSVCTVPLPGPTACLDSATAERHDVQLRRLRRRRRRQREPPGRQREVHRHRRARSGDRIPGLTRPDERRTCSGIGRPARATTPTSPASASSASRRARSSRRTRATAVEVCPGLGYRDADCFVQNLTPRQEGDVRDLRARRGSQLLPADAAHGDAEGRRQPAAPADEGARQAHRGAASR